MLVSHVRNTRTLVDKYYNAIVAISYYWETGTPNALHVIVWKMNKSQQFIITISTN